MKQYDHKKLEKKWRKNWEESNIYQTLSAKKAQAKNMKPYYVLDMFPYPSGAGLHVGHPRGYIASDVVARMKRMQGYNVLHPMGFDSFGLPTEQYAIKTGKSPVILSDQLVKLYKEQLSILGFSYDWSRQVATHDPEYYRWTQWIFLQIYNSWYDKSKNKARPIDELVKLFETSGNAKVNAVSSNDAVQFSAKEWKSYSDLEKQNMLMKYRLAYEGYAEVNWCEEMGTVLANDEVIEKDGKMVSERGEFPVVKKQMRQWFMRITAYADRLIDGLATLDWSNSIKEIQKNWIGKSEGSEIGFNLNFMTHPEWNDRRDPQGNPARISVFTTRADTLFGVTYVVLAPEHPWVTLALDKNHVGVIDNEDEVRAYVEGSKKKSDEDRVAAKEKTGVVIKGLKAINPANGEEVPVWVADYVLASYGTGAVMAVPAHDERDFEFAEKYDLPIKHVISHKYALEGIDAERSGVETLYRKTVDAIIRDKDNNFYLIKEDENHIHFVGGGIEEGETEVEALLREIKEEVGFTDVTIGKKITPYVTCWEYRHTKGKNVRSYGPAYEVILNSTTEISSEIEQGKHKLVKVSKDDVLRTITWEHHRYMFEQFSKPASSYDNYGMLINSGEFDGMTSEEARKAITEFVGGKLVTKYKMRDAIFARQRYWGEPIPLQHSKDGVIQTIPEKQLPLTLPKVRSYAPAGDGQSPLATVKSWVDAGYETNTMPGWAGSSWYFLRYTDPTNKKKIADEAELDYWFGKNGGVNMYVGGAEHATGHLLYSRFWHKVLKDLGHVKTEEPFQALRNQGMIGGADGRKMSKRWGNVINPDDVVNDMGADTMRVYESFMGPFEAHLPWSIDGIAGSRRFIERVWHMQSKIGTVKTSVELEKIVHKTIKKVTDDIANFSFNTAISAMMICINAIDKEDSINAKEFKMFLQMLAPFAPHITDEIWEQLGEKKSIHIAPWPTFDPKKIIDDTVTMGIQINGKVRAEITLETNADAKSVEEAVMKIPDIQKWIEGKPVKKFIYIPGKIISIVL